MYPEFIKFLNLIGHDITISGYGTLLKCDNPCYIETEQKFYDKIAGIPVMMTEFKKIINLPDPEYGVYYIVNRITMDYVPIDRYDVFCVDTGPTAIRDENGQVIAVTQLSV
jgi:hypothetical protein